MKKAGTIALILFCLSPFLLSSQANDPRFKQFDSLLDANANEKALKLSLQLAEAYPTYSLAYIDQAYAYNTLKEDQKCIDAIDKAMQQTMGSEAKYSLYYLKADSYSRLQQEEMAMSLCDKYLKHFPKDGYALNLRGWLFYTSWKYDKAISDFEKALKDTSLELSERTNALATMGFCYLQKGEHQKAQYYDSLALHNDPTDYDASLLQADLLFYKSEFEKALQHYTQLFEKDTSSTSILYKIADCYFSLKDYDRALTELKTYLQRSPESSDANNLAAWILFLQGKYNDGMLYANKAIVQNDHNSDAYNTRGCLLYKKGSYVAALDDLTKSIQLDKKDLDSYYFRALCFLKTNRKEEACKDLEKVKEDKTYEPLPGEASVQELINLNCKK